jgi:hypothetical protein
VAGSCDQDKGMPDRVVEAQALLEVEDDTGSVECAPPAKRSRRVEPGSVPNTVP